jgi:hypothetical protein
MRYNGVGMNSQPACVWYNAIWAQETRQHSLAISNAACFWFTSLSILLTGKMNHSFRMPVF